MRRFRRSLDSFEALHLLPSAGVLVVWTVLMFNSGGFRPDTWLPAGLVLAGILAAALIGGRRVLPADRTARAAFLALAAFTVWCFASIAWSDAQGVSWDASDLLLVSLLAVWVIAVAPWRAASATVLMIGFSVAGAVACLVALITATGATDLTSRFEDFRFSPPLDYPNTTAAFGFMAAIPALVTAARPDLGVLPKTLAQGLATFLGAFALLPQSRGSVLGGLAAFVLLAIAVPFRWRLALHALLLALALVIASDSAGDLYTAASTTGKASGALSDAARTIGLVTLFGLLAGAALAAAENQIQLRSRGRRAARRLGWALAGLVAVAVIGAGVAKSTSIGNTVHDQWRSLSHPGVDYAGKVANQSTGRLSSIDPLERYDYWRVSADGFRAAPVGGMGAGGFEHRYTLERRYPKVARYPHNLALKVAGDTGAVGVLLTGGFVVLVGIGLLSRRRRIDVSEAAVTAIGVAVLGYFLAHGQFDWLEAYPVLVGPALAFPVVALVVRSRGARLDELSTQVVEPRGPAARRYPAPPWQRPAVIGGGVLAGLLVVYALGAPWLALRFRERAANTWRTDPRTAYADLDRADQLDPLSRDADVLKGVIAVTRGDLDLAASGFNDALDREQDWLPHFGLAVVAAASGDRRAAAVELKRARALNPRDPNLPTQAKRVLTERPLDRAAAIRDVLVSPLFATEKIR